MANDIRLIIKENVRFFRNRLKIPQQVLAERCGVSTTYIGELETGRKYPSMQTLVKLAEVLQVEPYRLLLPHDYQDSENLDRFAEEVQESIHRMFTEVRQRY